MIEGAIFFAIGIIAYLITKILRLRKENQDLKIYILEKKYRPQNEDDIAKEDFLKFVSESREWAFDYIEEVQEALEKFHKAVKRDIEYFDKNGDPMGMKPNYDSLVRISAAYKDLMSILPEENDETKRS